jgi:hypothetical protein
MWGRRSFLATLAPLVAARGNAAPAPPKAAPSKSAAPAARRCRVTAWLGEPPLQASDIQATVEGHAARVVALRPPTSPLLLQLVMDLTGDPALIEPARNALKTEIAALPPTTWVSLLRAQDGLAVLADPAPGRDALLTQLDALQTTGRAGLLEAVVPASGLAERILRRSAVRSAVLFLTDSNIYNYREDYTNPVINPSDSRDLSRRFPEALVREKTAKLAAALNTASVPIFIQHLAWLRDRLNEAYQAGLQQIAEATGGAAAFSRAPGDIGGDITQMFAKINTHWAVDLELPPAIHGTYSVQLAVAGREIQYRAKFTLPPREKESKS